MKPTNINFVNRMARNVVRHVQGGGYLGASWPQYAAIVPLWDFDHWKVIEAAERLHPSLWEESRRNFEAEASRWD